MKIKEFYDPDTSTMTYIVYDNSTKDCIVIDPVLSFNSKNNLASTRQVSQVIAFINSKDIYQELMKVSFAKLLSQNSLQRH